MQFNVEDYLSADEMGDIARDAFRSACLDKFTSDAERIFTNAAYKAVWQVVDAEFDGKAAEMVAAKIPEIIDKLSEYTVFRTRGVYDSDDSPGQKAVHAAVAANKDAINAAVLRAISSISKDDIMDAIMDGDFLVAVERR